MPNTKRKRMIVNADDFGWAPPVTAGILRAHREGVVTSTTLAANMPGAAAAADALADAPDLGVGVHLNLSQGRPLSREGAALADDDGVMRRTAAGLIAACCLRPWLLTAVEAECDAQIRWALDHGIVPTHLDSHRHAHAFWPVFLRVIALARRYHIPFVRRHREVLGGRGWPAAPARQRRTRCLLNAFGAAQPVLAPDVLATVGTWGIAHTGAIDAAWLVRAIENAPRGAVEVMVHPGEPGELGPARTRLRDSRQAELAALCDPAVADALRRGGVELTHYGRLHDSFIQAS